MGVFHANGASLFFVCLFLHTGRGLYYISFKYYETGIIGVTLLILTMATAFLGYVLPWGQMSFWGATVITNLFSAIPIIGTEVVNWMWGGFAVGNPTLSRFYSLHFLLPFLISATRVIHILFLHQTGSSNPLGVNSNYDKLPFHQYYSIKDTAFYPTNKPLFWSFCSLVILLTWIGARPVEDPYILVGQVLTTLYFLFFVMFISRSFINKNLR